MFKPLISIVMSVYNGEKFLDAAVESMLKQTFKDFEFIIINDGSTDKSSHILKQISRKDKRIIIIEQENKGLISSLNIGCKKAIGEYIARMDADDICSPLRLEKQLHFLEKHPEIGIVGSQAILIDENGRHQHRMYIPCTPKAVAWSLHFTNPIMHSVVLMRSEIIKRLGYYDHGVCHAEDYDLWVRSLEITKIANLPDVFIQRRFWPGNVCSRHQKIQHQTIVKIMHKTIENTLDLSIPSKIIEDLHQFDISNYISNNSQKIKNTADLIILLYMKYKKDYTLSRIELREINYEAIRKMALLAKSAMKISPFLTFYLFENILKMNCALFLSEFRKRCFKKN